MMNWTGIKVLVIEDDAVMLEVLAATLKLKGAAVQSVRNGLEGLEELKREKFDIVISDVRMPVCDGLQFLDKCREEKIQIPVVILATGFADVTEAQAKARGALALVKKPFIRTELFEAIEAVLLARERRAHSA